MIKLGVNIDHVATLRQARKTFEPDPITAASLAVLGGADIITVHLREDRRHIQDRDVRLLRETVCTKLNLEMSTAPEIVDIALKTKPEQITLVPEKRQEITTEGGLDIVTQKKDNHACRKKISGRWHPGQSFHRRGRGSDRGGKGCWCPVHRIAYGKLCKCKRCDRQKYHD